MPAKQSKQNLTFAVPSTSKGRARSPGISGAAGGAPQAGTRSATPAIGPSVPHLAALALQPTPGTSGTSSSVAIPMLPMGPPPPQTQAAAVPAPANQTPASTSIAMPSTPAAAANAHAIAIANANPTNATPQTIALQLAMAAGRDAALKTAAATVVAATLQYVPTVNPAWSIAPQALFAGAAAGIDISGHNTEKWHLAYLAPGNLPTALSNLNRNDAYTFAATAVSAGLVSWLGQKETNAENISRLLQNFISDRTTGLTATYASTNNTIGTNVLLALHNGVSFVAKYYAKEAVTAWLEASGSPAAIADGGAELTWSTTDTPAAESEAADLFKEAREAAIDSLVETTSSYVIPFLFSRAYNALQNILSYCLPNVAASLEAQKPSFAYEPAEWGMKEAEQFKLDLKAQPRATLNEEVLVPTVKSARNGALTSVFGMLGDQTLARKADDFPLSWALPLAAVLTGVTAMGENNASTYMRQPIHKSRQQASAQTPSTVPAVPAAAPAVQTPPALQVQIPAPSTSGSSSSSTPSSTPTSTRTRTPPSSIGSYGFSGLFGSNTSLSNASMMSAHSVAPSTTSVNGASQVSITMEDSDDEDIFFDAQTDLSDDDLSATIGNINAASSSRAPSVESADAQASSPVATQGARAIRKKAAIGRSISI